MAHNCLYTALRAPRSPPVQLPLFLVPSFVSSTAPTPRSRNYANHAKMPKNLPKNKRDPIADPNASRKHLKPDFPISTRKHNRDMNRKRGVSAMRSTGPRQPLSVSKWALPMPETDPEVLKQKRKDPQFDSHGRTANHGLWQFFYNKKSMSPPEEIGVHGREWTYAELSLKSFEDLHALYWVAHKEHNRIMTNSSERIRLHAGYGASEEETRENTVVETQNNIRDVLRDRYESVEEAHRLADSNFMADLNLDENFDDQYSDGDYLPESELADTGSTFPHQGPSSADHPPTKLKF